MTFNFSGLDVSGVRQLSWLYFECHQNFLKFWSFIIETSDDDTRLSYSWSRFKWIFQLYSELWSQMPQYVDENEFFGMHGSPRLELMKEQCWATRHFISYIKKHKKNIFLYLPHFKYYILMHTTHKNDSINRFCLFIILWSTYCRLSHGEFYCKIIFFHLLQCHLVLNYLFNDFKFLVD